MTEVEKPDDYLTVKVNDQDKQLFMSAGLVRKIAMIAGEFDDFSVVYLDAGIQERCMVEALVDRDNRGNPVEDPAGLTMMAFNMSTSDADKLAKWLGDHVINFFISGATNMKSSVEVQEKVFRNLAQSLNGMSDSIQTKPSAGPLK